MPPISPNTISRRIGTSPRLPNTSRVNTLGHVFFAFAATLMTWRALEQTWLDIEVPRSGELTALRFAVPFALAAGSALAIASGVLSKGTARALRQDALSFVITVLGVFVLALGGLGRDVIGLLLLLIVVARLAPAAWWTIRYGAPPPFVFALALAFYVPLAAWRVAASLPLGDQVFYLLSSDALAHGSLDAHIDAAKFTSLLGIAPSAFDAATHVAAMPVGDRLVQGYALPAIVLPGWVIAGQLGATIVIAVFAAWGALQTWHILTDVLADSIEARVTWALVAFCAPLALLAVHVLPNAVGAALIATGYRSGFTARTPRPLVAGIALGATAFLNPRDGLVLAVLIPFVLRWPAPSRMRFLVGVAALVVLAALVSLVTFGIPVPYAGYVFGTAAAQTIDPEPTWTFRFWIGLPAILFDRVFGVAGSAPWVFIAALGVASALAHERARLLPAAVATAASVIVLSLFRLWEGGYAPPNRYLVDVLPLVAPFVAFGIAAARAPVLRALAGVSVALGALMTALLLADPSAALNTAFEDKPRSLVAQTLAIDPLGWLPSFQPITPDWWIGAYMRLIPAVLVLALLAWYGTRRVRA